MKHCRKCGITKLETEFYRRTDRPVGLQSTCKSCQSKQYAEYHAKNKEKLNAEWRARWQKNKTKYMVAKRKYWTDNPTVFLTSQARRRLKEVNNGQCENISKKKVYRRDGGVCYLCNLPAIANDWHLDHVYPISRGGTHIYSNVKVTHAKCNLRKNDKLLEELLDTDWVDKESLLKVINAPYYSKFRMAQPQ
jgi:5-methylcytosine-specific restriction endonuclease McrA